MPMKLPLPNSLDLAAKQTRRCRVPALHHRSHAKLIFRPPPEPCRSAAAEGAHAISFTNTMACCTPPFASTPAPVAAAAAAEHIRPHPCFTAHTGQQQAVTNTGGPSATQLGPVPSSTTHPHSPQPCSSPSQVLMPGLWPSQDLHIPAHMPKALCTAQTPR